MPRLNIYVADDVYALAERWRGSKNLSEICARALREELQAAEDGRTALNALSRLRPMSQLEAEVASHYQLKEVLVCETSGRPGDLRDHIGIAAAGYTDSRLRDGMHFIIGGGRQTWSVVRALSPRSLRLSISAMGVGQVDPHVLHAHPNTLVTIASLLYAPRSTAALTGTDLETHLASSRMGAEEGTLVLASCAPYTVDAPIVKLLGTDVGEQLQGSGAVGDFAYHFLTEDGRDLTWAAPSNSSLLSADRIRHLIADPESRVVMVAGGKEKLSTMRATFRARLCDTLITDRQTAQGLC
jgi:DNA-binding transcriptional regulator LsrR (DeoR family)